jgi:hypothetical protein
VSVPEWVEELSRLQAEYDSVKGVTFHSSWEDFLFIKLRTERCDALRSSQIRERHIWQAVTEQLTVVQVNRLSARILELEGNYSQQ